MERGIVGFGWSDHWKGVGCLVLSAFGFALMAACVRLCDDFGAPVSSFQKSFFRNLIAFAIAFVVWWRARRARSIGRLADLSPRARAVLLLRAIVGTGGIFANFYALSHIPIAEGQTLNKTAPFFTVLCAGFFLGERPNRAQWTALAIAFGGVLLIVKPGFAGASAFPLVIGLLGGLCAGAAYVCVRDLRRQGVSPVHIVLFFSAFSCLASVPFMLRAFDPMSVGQILSLLGAGLGGALGQFGVTSAYGYAPPKEIAVYDYTNIVFTAFFGWILFAQMPDAWSILGMVTIVLAALRMHASPRGT